MTHVMDFLSSDLAHHASVFLGSLVGTGLAVSRHLRKREEAVAEIQAFLFRKFGFRPLRRVGAWSDVRSALEDE